MSRSALSDVPIDGVPADLEDLTSLRDRAVRIESGIISLNHFRPPSEHYMLKPHPMIMQIGMSQAMARAKRWSERSGV